MFYKIEPPQNEVRIVFKINFFSCGSYYPADFQKTARRIKNTLSAIGKELDIYKRNISEEGIKYIQKHYKKQFFTKFKYLELFFF
jgi:hypothetical protein